ncbi:hypothetical protein RclHR1_01780015 [Rhizophagus clarus]|uniref:Uncharacterized protein n=1 Tax=Rhizophagus clarus TaxID=94130 RepID=A0A2Z6RE21_9GLOM|nr:hypothetical protein RclHR1_01780015 [Rhizophagus clarus]
MEVVEFTEINPSSYAAAYGSTDYSDSSDEVHTALRVYSSILNSQDSLAEIFFLLEKKVGDTVEHGISRTVQNLVNSGIPHQYTQKTISKSVSDDHQSLQNLPVDPDAMQISLMQILYYCLLPLVQLMLNQINLRRQRPSWSHAKIIAELKAWGDVISMMIKRQRKYQMLRIKICLSTFSLASFDQSIWQYFLDDQADHTKPSTIFSHYPIKALKHFNSGGKSQIVAYFERYQDNKNKKPTKNSNKQNSGSPKPRSTNSKPTKDQTKSSKKSKDKKKKKSSGKTSNDKIDIVKLLLALIS